EAGPQKTPLVSWERCVLARVQETVLASMDHTQKQTLPPKSSHRRWALFSPACPFPPERGQKPEEKQPHRPPNVSPALDLTLEPSTGHFRVPTHPMRHH